MRRINNVWQIVIIQALHDTARRDPKGWLQGSEGCKACGQTFVRPRYTTNRIMHLMAAVEGDDDLITPARNVWREACEEQTGRQQRNFDLQVFEQGTQGPQVRVHQRFATR